MKAVLDIAAAIHGGGHVKAEVKWSFYKKSQFMFLQIVGRYLILADVKYV